MKQEFATAVDADRIIVIAVAHSTDFSSRAKHIDIRHNFWTN